MTARDELASVISEAVGGWNQNTRTITSVADAILAAGYRKPKQVATIIDLAILGASATVLAANGVVWVNDGDHANPWASVVEDPQGGPVWADDSDILLPATVLYEPEPQP